MHLNLCDKPRALPGQTAFRVMSAYGWLKISAKDSADAMRQALRMIREPRDLQIWNGVAFVKCGGV